MNTSPGLDDDYDAEPTTMSELIAREMRNKQKKATFNTPNRQRITEIQTAYNQAVEQVRKDPFLSERGKQQKLALAYTNVKREIDKLKKADRDAQIQRYDQVERQLFGSAAAKGADAVSFRDAADRAAKLDNAASALQALGIAQMSGDDVLAKAITMRAWQAGWNDVTESYAIQNPSVTDQLAELGALRNALTSRPDALTTAMGTHVDRPEELRGIANITALAEEKPSLSLTEVALGRANGTITPTQEREHREQHTADALAMKGGD